MSTTYFEARTLHNDGQVKSVLVFAQSAMQARQELARSGVTVLSVRQRQDSRLNREIYSANFVIAFFEGLLYRLDVGEGPGMALVQHIRAEPNQKKRSEMQRAVDVLERGGSFPGALAALPFVSKEVAAIAEASDAGGEVRRALGDILDLLKARKKGWALVTGAFAWLSLDLSTVVSAVFGIHFVALPWLRDNPPQVKDPALIEKFNTSLAWVSSASLTVTVLTVALIAASVLITVFALLGGKRAKAQAQKAAMLVPVIREVYVHGALASGMLLLSRLSARGVPLQRSLDLLAGSTGVMLVAEYWRSIKTSLNAGLALNEAVGSSSLLQENELSAIRSQRNRSQFSEVLGTIAVARQAQAEGAVKNLVRLAVIVTIGYMVLAMSVGLWMLMLQNESITGSFDQLMKGAY